MKKHLLSALLISGFASAQLLSENFNAGVLPTGWTVENPDTSFNWQVGSQLDSYTFLPDGAAFFNDDDAGLVSINSNARLVSPVINLSAVSNPILSFKYANRIYQDDSILKVEVFNGSAWVQVFSFAGEAGIWGYDPDTYDDVLESYDQAAAIDLTPYANANFRVRFVYDDAGDFSYYAVVDDVLITAANLSTTESKSSSNQLQVYPNPVSDFIHIKNADFKSSVKLEVMDMNGRKVKSFEGVSDQYDLSNLSSGSYILSIDNGGVKTTKKIIKK